MHGVTNPVQSGCVSVDVLFEASSSPTSGLRGTMSISVELCPIPLGMPAVRYITPTVRFFRASLAAFISSTVTPTSAKLCTPGLAEEPSSQSLKWWLWLAAVEREKAIEEM